MKDRIETVVFSCDKPTVLNGIYDVIDSLGLITEHINSERGVLVISSPNSTPLRITVDTVFPSKDTKVSIMVTEDLQTGWVCAIFDELRSILRIDFQRKSV